MSALLDLYKKGGLGYIEEMIMKPGNYAWGEMTLLQQGELKEKAAEELAALRARVRVLEDGLLISGNLLTDVKNFIEVEVKVCGGVGMEYEIGLLDCIDAFQDLHGETVKELGEKHEKRMK